MAKASRAAKPGSTPTALPFPPEGIPGPRKSIPQPLAGQHGLAEPGPQAGQAVRRGLQAGRIPSRKPGAGPSSRLDIVATKGHEP